MAAPLCSFSKRRYHLLSRLVHQVVRRNGNKLWYRSPFREESKPSFCVEPGQQVRWIFSDYGANVKGNILDFVMHYQHLPIKSALHWLEQIFSTVNLNITFEQHASISAPSPFPSPFPSPIKLYRIKPIQHPALLSYLHQRAIEKDLAKRYLWELHYYNTGRPLFALGWKTDLGGWCLRANNFKAALSPAGITSIGTNNYCLAIFEGMFDFLAALSHFHSIKPRGLVIILNSVNNAHFALTKILSYNYRSIKLYLDNDPAGKKATQLFLTLKNSQDCSSLFSLYKDFADFHLSLLK